MKISLLLISLGLVTVRSQPPPPATPPAPEPNCQKCKTIADGELKGTYLLKEMDSTICNDLDNHVNNCLYERDGTDYCFRKGGYEIGDKCPGSGGQSTTTIETTTKPTTTTATTTAATTTQGAKCIECVKGSLICNVQCSVLCKDPSDENCKKCIEWSGECPQCIGPCSNSVPSGEKTTKDPGSLRVIEIQHDKEFGEARLGNINGRITFKQTNNCNKDPLDYSVEHMKTFTKEVSETCLIEKITANMEPWMYNADEVGYKGRESCGSFESSSGSNNTKFKIDALRDYVFTYYDYDDVQCMVVSASTSN